MKSITICLILWLGSQSLWAQLKEGLIVPKDFVIENPYTESFLEGVSLKVELLGSAAKTSLLGEYLSDKEGTIKLELTQNNHYRLTISKKGYYSQIIQIENEDLPQHGGKHMVSLRPSDCEKVEGRIEGIDSTFNFEALNAQVLFVKMDTKDSVKVRIREKGYFLACLKEETTYFAQALIPTYKSSIDTFKVQDNSVNTGVGIQLNLKVEEDIPPVLPKIYKTEDTIQVKGLAFKGKTTSLSSGNDKDLEYLYTLLTEHPTINVELKIHTDARKSDRFNLILAQKRGNMIEAYLSEKGIDKKRCTIISVGETEPINNCKDGVRCSDAQHAENNRVELKVLKGEENQIKD